MTLYSFNGAYPAPLPSSIRLSDGRLRTDRDSFTSGELADAGYVQADAAPSYDEYTEDLGWDGSDWTVTAKGSGEIASILASYVAIRQGQIDAQRDALLAAGKTISGKTYKGQIGDIGGITVARERSGRTATGGAKTISGITQADPGVVTANAHAIPSGTWALIESAGGMTELNDNAYIVESLSTNTLSLKDAVGNDIDTSGFTTYTSGGTITPVVPFITAGNETVYQTLTNATTISDTLTEWHNNMFIQGRAHKDAVAALTTVAAVQAYDSSSWPT